MSSTNSTPSNPYLDEHGRTDAEIYLTSIYDGKTIASKHMRMLAELMLPRFSEEYHGFHFNVNKALRPVQFIEKFCCFPEGAKMGKPFVMEQFQKSAIELAYGFVDENERRQFQQVIMEIARKNGKALSLDTEIPTPNGWRLMGDIHVGDYVFGQDGKASRVIAESEIFDKPMYLLTFEDGATLKATDDHIWTVRENGGEWHDMTTVELIDAMATTLEKGSEWEVPRPKPVEYPENDELEDPYSVGLRHGNEDVPIPDEYLLASVRQRRLLLDGILASGAMCRQEWARAYVSTRRSDVLIAQVRELATSLGLACALDNGCPVSAEIYDHKEDGKIISEIMLIPNEPSKCIAIDNESHLYLAGRGYTATHNTSLMAALCLYHLTSDGEPGAEVYNCAPSESQARKCYAGADQMRLHSPMLKNRIRRGMAQKTGKSALNFDSNGSMLQALAANPRKKDGLSASAIIYDELAAVEDNGALLDQLEESTSSRREPITWIISSENYIRDGIWDERISYCQGILKGTVQDDTVLPLLYTLDNRDEIHNELYWVKANPGLYVIKDVEKLRKRVNLARQSPSRLPSVLTKEFCLRSGAYSSYLDIADCINEESFDFSPEEVPYVCVGFDLASRDDLCCAVARWMMPNDGNIYEIAKFWVPADSVNTQSDANQKDKVPYLLWSSQYQEIGGGNWHWVEIVEGDRVNQMVIIDFLRDLVDVGMYPYCVAYDPWHVDDWTDRELKRLVGDSRTYAVPQTARTISPLMKEHKLDLHAHKVICPNPCLHHCRSNVQARVDNNDNVFPQKKNLSSHNKIDGFMAELFALAGFKKFEEEYLSAINWEPPKSEAESSEIMGN